MKIYIVSIVALSIFASAVILLSPEGKNGGIAKHLRLLSALCLLAVITDPLLSFVKKLSSPSTEDLTHILIEGVGESDAEDIFLESISDFSASSLQNELERLICLNFGIDKSDISVSTAHTKTSDGISFSSVTVKISGMAILKDPRDIENYVTELTGLPCKCKI
jgi:hypothetical protein